MTGRGSRTRGRLKIGATNDLHFRSQALSIEHVKLGMAYADAQRFLRTRVEKYRSRLTKNQYSTLKEDVRRLIATANAVIEIAKGDKS